ncbi:MAG: TetR/AcrR family transcriptional regulator [Oscillospiraceae bacterium]|nr:TetR/AcrR family transcriptional regulator [Oscillospiraceae bacterium]
MNEKDRRYQHTHRKLENSFLALLNEKDPGQITIGQITERAKCNRNTFYLHYRDKEDLLEGISSRVLADVAGRLSSELPLGSQASGDSVERYLGALLDYFEENRLLFGAMARGSESFRRTVQDAIYNGIVGSTLQRGIRDGQRPALEVYALYLAAGVSAVAFSWMEKEEKIDRASLQRLLFDVDAPCSEVIIRKVLRDGEEPVGQETAGAPGG